MLSVSHKNQANIIDAFNSTSQYFDDSLVFVIFDKNYPNEIQINKTNTSDTKVLFLD